ncbi:hypothetical protein DMP05_09720, partial [Slackia isoflavoniconvertens]
MPTSLPSGTSTSMFFRLCTPAPRTSMRSGAPKRPLPCSTKAAFLPTNAVVHPSMPGERGRRTRERASQEAATIAETKGRCLMKDMKIALVQFEGELGEVEKNVADACALVAQAAENGADLVVLPELFSTGYHLDTIGPRILEL